MKCTRCKEPVLDAPACTDCAWQLHLALRDVPGHVTELETVLARLTAYSDQAQRVTGGRETPVPFHATAGLILGHLHATLASWVRLVHREKYRNRSTRPPTGPACTTCAHQTCTAIRSPWRAHPTDRPAALAGWLRPEVEWLRHHDTAADAIDEIRDAVRDVRTILDAPAGRKTDPLGPCPTPGCPGEVRAYLPRDPNAMAHCDCSADPEHTWDSTQFLRLGKRMERIHA